MLKVRTRKGSANAQSERGSGHHRATRGIGNVAARQLVERGYTVFGTHRVVADADNLRRQGIHPLQMDVCDLEAVQHAAKEVEASSRLGQSSSCGCQQCRVHRAGPVGAGYMGSHRGAVRCNVTGLLRVTRAFLPMLRRDGGRIVNVSAASARVALPFVGPVSASKAAVDSISAALRIELKQWSIPVSIVEPGASDTSIFAAAAERYGRDAAALPKEQRMLYANQLTALDRAMQKQKLDDPTKPARGIVKTIEAKRPRTRYLAGPAAT